MLQWLPDRTRGQIAAATSAAAAALGDSLIAVCLIGGAAKPGREQRGAVAPELLIVAEQLGADSLRALATGLVEPLRAGLQIRTVTRAELRGSVDVHALELAQWRDQHLRLAGSDPFAELEIAATDLRHEIERALRTLGHRLRNRLLWCLATDQQRLDALLRESLERLIGLAEQTARLRGETPDADEAALLEGFLRWSGAEVDGILALRERLSEDAAAGDPIAELAALTSATEAATDKVDALDVG